MTSGEIVSAHMKVAVALTVEIDADAWTLNYGVEGRAAIREDVRAYVADMVRDQLRAVGVSP